MQTALSILLIAAIWLLPVAAYALEHHLLKRLFAFVTRGFDCLNFDHDYDGYYDARELTHGMSPTARNEELLDYDNDGLLNLHEYWLDSHAQVYDQTNSVIQLFVKSIDDRLVPNISSNDVEQVLPKFSVYEENNFVPNTNFWLHGVDTSCVSMWTDLIPEAQYVTNTTPSQRSGVAISKRHILQANHWAVTNNMHVIFYGTDGNVYSNQVVGSTGIGGDIRIALLAEDLPDAVSIAKVMPLNFYNYIGDAVRIPFFFLDQDEHAHLCQIWKMNAVDQTFYCLQKESKEIYNPYYKTPIGGDSGSPFFFLAGNEIVLIGVVWKIATYSSFLGFYIDRIQNAMDSLLPGQSDRNRLQLFDFSDYSQIFPERNSP